MNYKIVIKKFMMCPHYLQIDSEKHNLKLKSMNTQGEKTKSNVIMKSQLYRLLCSIDLAVELPLTN